MKSYTDIEQSKKLAEFLSLESADMYYWKRTWKEGDYSIGVGHSKELQEGFTSKWIEYIPCWSLTALFYYLSANYHVDIKYLDGQWELDCRVKVTYNKELVDACYEMFLKLHEQELL